MQRAEHGLHGAWMLCSEVGAEGADLLRMIRPQGVRRDGGKPTSIALRDRIPRFARAESIEASTGKIPHHHRRWNGDQGDVAVGINATRRQPVTQPKGMRAGWKRLGKHQRATHFDPFRSQAVQRAGVGLHRARVALGQRDGLSAARENPGNHQRRGLVAENAETRGQRHAVEHLRGVNRAGLEGVARCGPTGDPHCLGVQSLGREESAGHRDQQRCGIGQREESQSQIRDLRRPRATAAPAGRQGVRGEGCLGEGHRNSESATGFSGPAQPLRLFTGNAFA